MDPEAPDEPSREELESRVEQLEETVSKMLPDRRGVIKGLGAAAIGAGVASSGASGQSAAGQVGTASEPVDVEAANVAAQSVSTGDLNNRKQVGPNRDYPTLKAAHDALPTAGGVVEIVDTPTETGDVDITKPIKIIGQGMPFDTDASAYIDLDGNAMQIKTKGVTTQNLQAQNGKVIIGEHDVFGGRHDIGLSVRHSPTDGIEFRGGHLDSHFDIKSHQATDRGIVWNLDTDGVDYFNQNEVKLMSHSSGGDGVVVTGVGSSTALFNGNDFLRFDSENNSSTGLVVDDFVQFRSNKLFGYGVHDGGVDVRPNSSRFNVINWSKCGGGGDLQIGGEVKLGEPSEAANLSPGENTTLYLDQDTTITPEDWRLGNPHPTYSGVSTSAVTILSNINRNGWAVVMGEDQSDGTVNFVDIITFISFGSAAVVSQQERNTPAARSYTVNGGQLELSMGSDSYNVQVDATVSSAK